MKMMNTFAVGAFFGTLGMIPMTANAATLYNGWQYATDNLSDADGGTQYDMRSMAISTIGGTTYVAMSNGMRPGGTTDFGDAINGRISLGDLFLNFSGHNLDSAAKFNDPMVYGIRFDSTNDSFGNLSATPNAMLGVFGGITTAALSALNFGPDSIDGYNTLGNGRTVDAMGDLQSTLGDVSDYLGRDKSVETNIASGRKLGDIVILDRAALEAQGLDFAHLGGGYDTGGDTVFGFSFSSSLLPSSDFTAHLFEECNNDGIAIMVRGGTTAVPEPGNIALLLGMSVAGVGCVARRRRK